LPPPAADLTQSRRPPHQPRRGRNGDKIMSRLFLVPAVVATASLAALVADPAAARITCKDGYQLVNGNLIATPYCQDALVGSVAREYGVKVSDSEVMNNPNLKRNVCQFVGRDIRLATACVDVNSVGRRF